MVLAMTQLEQLSDGDIARYTSLRPKRILPSSSGAQEDPENTQLSELLLSSGECGCYLGSGAMPFSTTIAEGDDFKVQQSTNPDRVSSPMCYAGSQYDINTGVPHLLSWRAMSERHPDHRRDIVARGDAIFL